MKVCLLSNSDGRGGAYAAAYRLHQGLRSSGLDSTMLVGKKSRDDFTVVSSNSKLAKIWRNFAPSLDALPKFFYTQRENTPYSIQWLPDQIASQVAQINPDIINLHWINAGYLQIETIAKFNKPIVWSLHDMWPFTGGCHYNQDCDRYTNSCGSCPQLHSTSNWDLSHWVWQRKAKALKNLNLTIVALSHWLAKCASASSLFQDLPVKVIPNGIDTTKYKPIEQKLARKLLDLPDNKQLVLFGAINATSATRKGFHLLQPSLQYLSQSGWQEKLEVVIFGASEPINPPNLGFKCHYLGRLNDDISIVLAYCAADVMVVPSIQDNLPNTVMEAIACGIPCVAFNIGGIPDMIEHQHNGYLARPFEEEDLAAGIAWILEDKERWQGLSSRAREKVEREFTPSTQASAYLKLYNQLLEGDRPVGRG